MRHDPIYHDRLNPMTPEQSRKTGLIVSGAYHSITQTIGSLEKLSSRPISLVRNQILSMEYHVYVRGKMILRASILNEIPVFSSSAKGGRRC
jgi:hypothetical protein